MRPEQIEQRLAALEQDVAELRAKVEGQAAPARPWWHETYGRFANDPIFEEIVRLGREYRESLRPKPKPKSVKRARP